MPLFPADMTHLVITQLSHGMGPRTFPQGCGLPLPYFSLNGF